MALVNGRLRDFQVAGAWAINNEAEVEFIPSNPAYAGEDLRSDASIIVPVDSGGAFAASLAPTGSLQPAGTHYRVRIRWLGEYMPVFTDVPGKLFVPGEGGNIGDLLEQSPGAEQVFWQPTKPDPWPRGSVWVNTLTWDVSLQE